jgi:predicted HTH domain antitoxin
MELTLELPDSMALDEKDLKIRIAIDLYENGILDSGDAAEMAGLSRREFIETMPRYGYSIFDMDESEIEEDLENARNW